MYPWGGAQPHLIRRPTPGAPSMASWKEEGAVGRVGSRGGTSSPDAWGRAERPSSTRHLREHAGCASPGECMTTSPALRPSAPRTRRPPASEQPFTVYKARSLTWALEPWALGQRSLVVPTLQMGTQRPKDEKWPLQAYATAAGHSQGGSWPCCPQAYSCLPQAASAASRVRSWAFLTIPGRPRSPVRTPWGFGVTRRT